MLLPVLCQSSNQWQIVLKSYRYETIKGIGITKKGNSKSLFLLKQSFLHLRLWLRYESENIFNCK